MEALIADGFVAGVADVTTTEWCDELVGGVLSAGPDRLDAAARAGHPAGRVASARSTCATSGRSTPCPPQFEDRNLYRHNPQVTLMRTTPEESAELGGIIAAKLNAATGPIGAVPPAARA